MPSSRSSSSPPSHLVVGTIGRAVGLRGEVEVMVHSDDPDRFAPGRSVLTAGELHPLTVMTSRTHRGRVIVRFDEVDDRDHAERLRGTDLVVPAGALRELPSDEWWDHDLVGCVVVTAAGDEVGRVTDVLHAPSSDLLVVTTSDDEHLVPLIRDIVRSVEPRTRIVIEPLPGLLD